MYQLLHDVHTGRASGFGAWISKVYLIGGKSNDESRESRDLRRPSLNKATSTSLYIFELFSRASWLSDKAKNEKVSCNYHGHDRTISNEGV